MRSLFGLEGKTMLVVGGGLGMGEATVKLLASLGANVAVLDLDLARAERVAADAEAAGVRALALSADVTDETAVIAAVAEAERALAPLDGMATIVGMAAWSSIVDMSSEVWDLDHRRNLKQFFLTAREVARSLMRRGAPGSIVAVASIDGFRSAPSHAAYGAAKAGILNLVKSMAVEWAEHGIRVNAVAPGAIVTPRLPLSDAERAGATLAHLPMKGRGSVDDIAKAIVFMLSDMSPYVTGQTLAVDGGYLAVGPLDHRPSVLLDENNRPKSARS